MYGQSYGWVGTWSFCKQQQIFPYALFSQFLHFQFAHCYSVIVKVQIFWEGHRIWKKSATLFWNHFKYIVMSNQIGRFVQIFVVFSEYLNTGDTKTFLTYYLTNLEKSYIHIYTIQIGWISQSRYANFCNMDIFFQIFVVFSEYIDIASNSKRKGLKKLSLSRGFSLHI